MWSIRSAHKIPTLQHETPHAMTEKQKQKRNDLSDQGTHILPLSFILREKEKERKKRLLVCTQHFLGSKAFSFKYTHYIAHAFANNFQSCKCARECRTQEKRANRKSNQSVFITLFAHTQSAMSVCSLLAIRSTNKLVQHVRIWFSHRDTTCDVCLLSHRHTKGQTHANTRTLTNTRRWTGVE